MSIPTKKSSIIIRGRLIISMEITAASDVAPVGITSPETVLPNVGLNHLASAPGEGLPTDFSSFIRPRTHERNGRTFIYLVCREPCAVTVPRTPCTRIWLLCKRQLPCHRNSSGNDASSDRSSLYICRMRSLFGVGPYFTNS